MKYKPPQVTVLSISTNGDVMTTLIECDDPSPYTPWPARLWDSEDPPNTVAELHRVRRREGAVITFETYGGDVPRLHEVGETYGLVGMWLDWARDFVVDRSREWSLDPYPADGDDCEYCPFTFKWFGRGETSDSVMQGYRSGDDWITVDAYERFIRDDIYRLREP